MRRRRAVLAAGALVAGLTAATGGAFSAPAGAATHALAVPVPRLPAGSSTLGPAPASQELSLDVVLSLRDPAAVQAAVAAVSTPGSPDYRHYLSPAAFAATFAPDPSTVQVVRAWLSAQGFRVGATDPDGFIVPVHAAVSTAQRAFDAPLDRVRLAGGRTAVVNTAVPTVPAPLASSVASVVGLDGLARPQTHLERSPVRPRATQAPAAPRTAGPQACAEVSRVTGDGGPYSMTQIAQAYGLGALYAAGRVGAGQTIALYELEQYSASDVDTFASCYGIPPQVSNVVVDGGPGGPSFGSGEAALDVEDAMAFAPSARLRVYEGDPSSPVGPLDLYATIADQDAASVVSTSWGVCEAMDQPAGTAQAEAEVFAQMALQGQGMVAASGDAGSEDCYAASAVPPSYDSNLGVDDPAAQPDVLGAGGTELPLAGNDAGESVWNDCQGQGTDCAPDSAGAGGGGISSVFTMPSWQTPVAGPSSSGTPCKAASGDCREVPDVAGDADPEHSPMFVFWDDDWVPVGGTSDVSPLWAAILSDVSQGCAAPVGFAAPALYRVATGPGGSLALHDVVSGDNDFTQNQGGKYPAAAGYDMASGWGSPVGAGLMVGLQPAGGCPSVTGLSAHETTLGDRISVTITGASLAGAIAVHFGAAGDGVITADSAGSLTVTTPSTGYPVASDVTVTTPAGTSAAVAADRFIIGTQHLGDGYWEVGADGGVFTYGAATYYGSMGGKPLDRPIVGMASTPDGRGYWEVASDGGLFAFGDARYYGSMGGKPLDRPIVGMASTPDGRGYWEVASDGGLFAFGDAPFHGSMGGKSLDQPIVGMASTPDGRGYWEVASDGGLFAFGDAPFHGSMGGKPLNRPIVGMAPSLSGHGYWEVASDGGLFAFGDAQFFGSAASLPLASPVTGLAPSIDGLGYWEVARDGGLFSYGDAPFFGSAGSLTVRAPVVAMAMA